MYFRHNFDYSFSSVLSSQLTTIKAKIVTLSCTEDLSKKGTKRLKNIF